MLGVLLFFDGALLALGNVRLTSLLQPTTHGLTCIIRIPCRVDRFYSCVVLHLSSAHKRRSTSSLGKKKSEGRCVSLEASYSYS